MALPKISIVTPCLNHAAFVEQTLQSVITQNYENLEYIVVDGGSTDGSVDIIEKYRPQLHYFSSEPDTGHGNALNKGFRQSTGDIMAWLNSDDIYMPWTFRTVAEIFAEFPNVNWISGTNCWLSDRGVLSSRNIYKNVLDYLSDNFEWIQQESVFWRRSLWEKTGGSLNEGYRLAIDGELWCRFFMEARLWHADCILASYRMHTANRAKLHRQEYLAEMRQAIGEMRAKIDARKLTAIGSTYPLVHYDFDNLRWKLGSLLARPG